MKTIGILLIVVGLVAAIWGGITYVNNSRHIAHLGPINVTMDKDGVSISPAVGIAALLIGGVLVVLSTRKGARLVM